MAINPDKKFNDPELQNIKEKIDQIPVNIPIQPPNEYLIKAQKKFAAVEWEQQIYFQLQCAKQPIVTLDGIDYRNTDVTDEQERDMAEKQLIWERFYSSWFIQVNRMLLEDIGSEKARQDMAKKIAELKKPVDEADTEYFATCCIYYYGIPREVALKHKELLLPYIIGRRYLHTKALVGNAFNDIKSGRGTTIKNVLNDTVNRLNINNL